MLVFIPCLNWWHSWKSFLGQQMRWETDPAASALSTSAKHKCPSHSPDSLITHPKLQSPLLETPLCSSWSTLHTSIVSTDTTGWHLLDDVERFCHLLWDGLALHLTCGKLADNYHNSNSLWNRLDHCWIWIFQFLHCNPLLKTWKITRYQFNNNFKQYLIALWIRQHILMLFQHTNSTKHNIHTICTYTFMKCKIRSCGQSWQFSTL